MYLIKVLLSITKMKAFLKLLERVTTIYDEIKVFSDNAE